MGVCGLSRRNKRFQKFQGVGYSVGLFYFSWFHEISRWTFVRVKERISSVSGNFRSYQGFKGALREFEVGSSFWEELRKRFLGSLKS